MNWDELEEGQVYEILFCCVNCGHMEWVYTRQQKKVVKCECGYVLMPDNYAVIFGKPKQMAVLT